MSVLGDPEPVPAGLWEAALDHALTAAPENDLGLLVPDLWAEPVWPDQADDGSDLADGFTDGEPEGHDGDDAYTPWTSDEHGAALGGSAGEHDQPDAGADGADGSDPWATQ